MLTKLLTLFTFAAVAAADFGLPAGSPFHIRSIQDQSLCAGYPSFAQGAPAIVIPCGAPTATWIYPGDGHVFARQSSGQVFALTPTQGSSSITLVPPARDPNQIWTYNQPDRTLRTASGMCATRINNRNVIAQPCRATDPTQAWIIARG
ncbi:hypothetical protein D9756_005745 [Leucocoprinus leucothites]|uniref:Ricin B lectin domain-containing protein n=1 Tax=Leucocoprinus leucothites TaxID=201217 RepID=A0A8H5D760_9AGAR|nr:hypothetical protein D9756_005745 [Leucoagaricus leucothites]